MSLGDQARAKFAGQPERSCGLLAYYDFVNAVVVCAQNASNARGERARSDESNGRSLPILIFHARRISRARAWALTGRATFCYLFCMATKTTRKATSAKPSEAGVKILSSRVTYKGPMFYVTAERIVEPSGNSVRRDVVHHRGSVVIMPLDESGKEPRVLLERQYRYVAKQEIWEFPAGGKDEGEDELSAAKRELLEETGYAAREWKLALHFYVSPGFLEETMAVFLARDLIKGKAQPEADEVISTQFVAVRTALRMVMDGRIKDAKTIAGVLWLARKLNLKSGID